MSYGIEVSTEATVQQIQTTVSNDPLFSSEIISDTLCFSKEDVRGCVEVVATDDGGCVYCVNIRGDHEDIAKEIILAIDKESEFTEQ